MQLNLISVLLERSKGMLLKAIGGTRLFGSSGASRRDDSCHLYSLKGWRCGLWAAGDAVGGVFVGSKCPMLVVGAEFVHPWVEVASPRI